MGNEKDLDYQRGGSRRRAYSGSQVAEAEEIKARQRHLIQDKEDGSTWGNCETGWGAEKKTGVSQVKSESQLPSQLRAPTSSAATGTREARGIAQKKTKAQKEIESQDRHRMENKEKWRIQAAKRKAKKEAKKMLPREDDVSQLAHYLLRSPSTNVRPHIVVLPDSPLRSAVAKLIWIWGL